MARKKKRGGKSKGHRKNPNRVRGGKKAMRKMRREGTGPFRHRGKKRKHSGKKRGGKKKGHRGKKRKHSGKKKGHRGKKKGHRRSSGMASVRAAYHSARYSAIPRATRERAAREAAGAAHRASYLAQKRAEFEALKAAKAHKPQSGLPSWF